MDTRRVSSRKVALTAAFLALAAGGVAACDSSSDDAEYSDTTTYGSGTGGYQAGSSDTGYGADDSDDYGEPVSDEVFYCADEDGEIVDEENCEDDSGTPTYFLWHSPGYARNLTPGTVLDSGEYFPPGDREARRAFNLPATGKVANGTVKTNVVGAGSGSGLSGGSTSSGG